MAETKPESPVLDSERSTIRTLLGLSWPIVFAVQLGSFQSLLMSLWLGRLVGVSGLAVEALVTPVWVITFWIVMVVPTGTTSVMARLVGAGASGREPGAGARLLLTSSTLQVAVCIPIAVTGLFALDSLARMLGSDAGLVSGVRAYVLPMCFAVPVMGLAETLTAILLGAGRTRVLLWRVLASLGLEASITPVFILVLGMGIAGPPTAALVALVVLVVGIILLLLRSRHQLGLEAGPPGTLRFDGTLARKLVRIGLPVQAARASNWIVVLVLTRVVLRDGKIAMAGFGLAIQVLLMCAGLTMALSNGAGILIGQSMGARRPEQALAALRTGATVVALVALASFLLVPYAGPVLHLFSSDDRVIAAAIEWLSTARWAFVGTSVSQVLLASYTATGVTGRAGLLMIVGDVLAVVLVFNLHTSGIVASAWGAAAEQLFRAALIVPLFRRSLLKPLSAVSSSPASA